VRAFDDGSGREVSFMPSRLILGNEAVAQGAIDAGIAGAFSYPGTPAPEIFEYVAHGPWAKDAGGRVSALWSANEKVAYEEALGMSYVGKRALVSMKHVGLNVAADPFVNSALTGVNGGLVLVVADDPGMHSSQNEQDSRYYGELAQIPVFEPSDQQAAYDLAARPPQLCRGCPHADSFKALVEATASYAHPVMFSDIGCYTLGVLPPYRAVHSCVDMGASIAMAHGATQAGYRPVICTIGDSTFAHSGMTLPSRSGAGSRSSRRRCTAWPSAAAACSPTCDSRRGGSTAT
jgi:TPP-dependent indolepyruvate ferredoxin oxidoreductase alpha subunit